MNGSAADAEETFEIAVECFGVRVAVASPSKQQIDRVPDFLPPGWRPCPPDDVDKRFTFELDAMSRWVLNRDGKPVTRAGLGPDHVMMLFELQLRTFIALHAPDLIFVHAGVVAVDGRLLVMPGYSFAGKTTLVAALVSAGAVYYSDEYAPIDADGLVHPYARALSMRRGDQTRLDARVGTLGGTAGEEPLPISRIVITNYRKDGEWAPRQLTGGESVLALLSHTVPAQSRPEQAMRHITRAVNGAVAVESPRGDSESFVPLLLDELRG